MNDGGAAQCTHFTFTIAILHNSEHKAMNNEMKRMMAKNEEKKSARQNHVWTRDAAHDLLYEFDEENLTPQCAGGPFQKK